jgi:5-methylcytosine-specific restriction endonuclease McrA
MKGRRLKKVRTDPAVQARVIAEARREQALRQQGYRERALALFPHLCARCGREFSGKALRELTVHHKDGNHLNNPPDGSNWELLCLSCHDDVHQEGDRVNYFAGYARAKSEDEPLGFNPFEGLKKFVDSED